MSENLKNKESIEEIKDQLLKDGKKDGNRKQPFLFPYRRSLW